MKWRLSVLVLLSGLCSQTYCLRQYHFIGTTLPWSEAQTHCREQYTDLATVIDIEEMNRLVNTAQSSTGGYTQKAWIGLHNDPASSRKWEWSDQSGSSYRYWKQGQPDNVGGEQNCVATHLGNAGLWSDEQCSIELAFICYGDKKTTTTTTTTTATTTTSKVTTNKITTTEGASTITEITSEGTSKDSLLSTTTETTSKIPNTGKESTTGHLSTDMTSPEVDQTRPITVTQNKITTTGGPSTSTEITSSEQHSATTLDQTTSDTQTYCASTPHQYHFIGTTLPWSEAQTYCREQYTDLATVIDIEEMNRLVNTAQSSTGGYTQKAWIGLHNDPASSRRWEWSDQCDFKYRYWKQGQPDNVGGEQNCVATHLGNAGLWSDEQCSMELAFICYGDKKNVLSSTTAATTITKVTPNKIPTTGKESTTGHLSTEMTSQGVDRTRPITDETPNQSVLSTTTNNNITVTQNKITTTEGHSTSIEITSSAQHSATTLDQTTSDTQTYCTSTPHQYHFIGTTLPWSEAQTYCREQYTDLATVIDIEEMNRLVNTAQSSTGGYTQKAWIGLHNDPASSRKWEWSDQCDFKYRYWKQGQPDNVGGEQNCVATHLGNAGLWSDEQCSIELAFICYGDKKNVLSSTTAATTITKVTPNKIPTTGKESTTGHLSTEMTSQGVDRTRPITDETPNQSVLSTTTNNNITVTQNKITTTEGHSTSIEITSSAQHSATTLDQTTSDTQTYCTSTPHQYHFIGTTLPWSEAQTYCREQYTDLATVIDIEEMNRLVNTAQSSTGGYTQKAWIGLHNDPASSRCSLSDSSYYSDDKRWEWSDQCDFKYRYWKQGQPDNVGGEQNCVATHLGNAGLWSDEQCSLELAFICYGDKKNVLSSTTIATTITKVTPNKIPTTGKESTTGHLSTEMTSPEVDQTRPITVTQNKITTTEGPSTSSEITSSEQPSATMLDQTKSSEASASQPPLSTTTTMTQNKITTTERDSSSTEISTSAQLSTTELDQTTCTSGCHSHEFVCGVAPRQSRIIGGQNASPGSWPWQASIYVAGTPTCGGSLINNQWVLTAAHCIMGYFSIVDVHLGLHSQSGENLNGTSRIMEVGIIHPKYNKFTLENDIALLKLSTPVNFTDYIQPICLASANSTFHTGINSWVTGWGNTVPGNPYSQSDILQEVTVQILGNNECQCNYLMDITENMICAGVRAGGKDACQGDSGGPLVTKNDAVWVQSGIVSFGEGCGKAKFPGVYTRVSQYQEWISNITGTHTPGFVTFDSPGVDSDLNFTCPTTAVPTYDPHTMYTTVDYTTTSDDKDGDGDGDVFGGGESVIHFSHFNHFFSLCVLVLSLYVLVGDA